jgi:hypothetical protein
MTASSFPVPGWWSEHYDSRWNRVKGALRRDWEQTKSDVAGRGHYLNQSAGDTVRQAAGRQVIPFEDMPTDRTLPDWLELEDAIRYGHAARQRYPDRPFDEIAPTLEREWHAMHTHLLWERARIGVRFGWNANRGTMI